jgi:hypothetical protein
MGYTEEDVVRATKAMSEAFRAYTGTPTGQVMWNLDMEKTWGIVAPAVLEALAAAGRLRDTGADRFKVGDLAATSTILHERVEGRVTKVADDGMVTIEVPQVGDDYRVVAPLVITAPAAEFAKVETPGPWAPAEPAAEPPVTEPRLRVCVDRWPEAQEGAYDPRCCRFPKSCSATIYHAESVSDDDLEPADLSPKGDVR